MTKTTNVLNFQKIMKKTDDEGEVNIDEIQKNILQRNNFENNLWFRFIILMKINNRSHFQQIIH